MSDKCCTFALEIGNELVLTSSGGKRSEQRRGATREEYPPEKHHTASVRSRKAADQFPISGQPLFCIYNPMKPTYRLLWEIIIDVLTSIIKRCTHL